MKAIVLEKAGGIENLVMKDINKPTINEKEVLVAVKAISINPADAKVRSAEEALKMFYHVANIGDARSLAIHPATTTHSQLNEEELLASGVTPGYVRLCIGLEHIDDIIEDLEQALKRTDNVKNINKAKAVG